MYWRLMKNILTRRKISLALSAIKIFDFFFTFPDNKQLSVFFYKQYFICHFMESNCWMNLIVFQCGRYYLLLLLSIETVPISRKKQEGVAFLFSKWWCKISQKRTTVAFINFLLIQIMRCLMMQHI